ncbi:prolipoprotein diacylglyceryl transferase [Polymorphobacter sp. PAMC 29334]|uniref:prolipoprotein diacylglyceryl transferase n=1 Tax=Polymorphobacter sp. PAMC 29334 TaxID=2862331 RepID=UPI001C762A76|nr:prolipoprotein diacylglyceryl transferase [Polymorphobacter sp. PAMC 29334]
MVPRRRDTREITLLDHARIALDWSSLGLSPVLFEFHGFALRWYSLAYIGGILGGWWLLGRMLDSWAAPMSRANADALITWATVGIILGGRIGYVLFYDFAKFAADPLAILRLWEGGMSFHGGAIGFTAAIFLFARANNLPGMRICDYVACVAPLGQGLGRLANFINGELWGRVTGSDWGIIFPGAGTAPRYPSQLFEFAGEGVLLFVVLNVLFYRTRARLYPGFLVGVGTFGFGLVRFCIEFFREPDIQVGYLKFGLTMGQWLCLPMVFLGLYLMWSSRARAIPAGAPIPA